MILLQGVISKLPDDVSQGQSVNVGGTYFYNKTDVS